MYENDPASSYSGIQWKISIQRHLSHVSHWSLLYYRCCLHLGLSRSLYKPDTCLQYHWWVTRHCIHQQVQSWSCKQLQCEQVLQNNNAYSRNCAARHNYGCHSRSFRHVIWSLSRIEPTRVLTGRAWFTGHALYSAACTTVQALEHDWYSTCTWDPRARTGAMQQKM